MPLKSTICLELRKAGIDVWENEGGAMSGGDKHHHYGRRIEADKSWTVYHVFTGVPAEAGKQPLTGLSHKDATAVMISLNAGNAEGRRSTRLSQAFSTPLHSLARIWS